MKSVKLLSLLLAVCLLFGLVAAIIPAHAAEFDTEATEILDRMYALIDKYAPLVNEDVQGDEAAATTADYLKVKASHYVAIGDDSAVYGGKGYVETLAKSLGVTVDNLAQTGMRIDEAVTFLNQEANAAKLKSADLITVGFSGNAFASLGIREILNHINNKPTTIDWAKYGVDEAGIKDIKAVVADTENYLKDKGYTANLNALYPIPQCKAVAIVMESFAYATLQYIHEIANTVDAIRALNSKAIVIIVGADNPMDGATVMLQTNGAFDIAGIMTAMVEKADKMNLNFAMKSGKAIYVSAPAAANDADGTEVAMLKLMSFYTGRVVDPAVLPNEKGHAYIAGQLQNALRVAMLGDANSDNRINVSDAMVALRYAVKKITAAELNVKASDVNSDGKVNVNDAMQILRYAVKKITEFKPAK